MDLSNYTINNSGPKEGTNERSVEYARRLLNTSNYFTTEHEALAIVWATIKNSKDRARITINTDQPLKWIMSLKSSLG